MAEILTDLANDKSYQKTMYMSVGLGFLSFGGEDLPF